MGALRSIPDGAAAEHARPTGHYLPAAAALAGVVLLVLLLYGRSVGYGAIWDDPVWFGQARGLSLTQLLGGSSNYQFYRPLSLWYGQLWWRSDGSLAIDWLHAMQVAWHGATCVLVMAMGRRWGMGWPTTALAGLIAAAFPFSHQAVAWAVPQQPAVTALIIASMLAFQRFRAQPSAITGPRPMHGRLGWLLASLALFAAALLTHEVAAGYGLWPMVLIVLEPGQKRDRSAALAFAILLLAYLLLRSQAARLGGVIEAGFDRHAAGFLAQAPAFWFVRLLGGALEGRSAAVVIAAAVAWFAGLARLVSRGKSRLAVLCTLWVSIALVPEWAALHGAYVELGQRLVYTAVPGIAVFWGAVAGTLFVPWRRARAGVGVVAILAVLGGAGRDVLRQDSMLQAGAAHLSEAVTALSGEGRRVLFVNFPDRYELRRSGYPIGYWGITLAPVVVDLSDLARLRDPAAGPSTSIALPSVGHAEREAWAYRVDMRGAPSGASDLADAARSVDAVYLTDYLDAGRLRLRHVGSLAGNAAAVPMATFGEAVELVGARVHLSYGSSRAVDVGLDLAWRRIGAPRATETVFVHLFDPAGRQVAGADGDGMGGLLPMAAWPADRVLEDVRSLRIEGPGPGEYRLTVGMYDRATGVRRRAAEASTGRRVRDDEYPIATIVARRPGSVP